MTKRSKGTDRRAQKSSKKAKLDLSVQKETLKGLDAGDGAKDAARCGASWAK
jgi:hypothetical protein